MSPVEKLKGSDPNSKEKFFLHSKFEDAGFDFETKGQSYF